MLNDAELVRFFKTRAAVEMGAIFSAQSSSHTVSAALYSIAMTAPLLSLYLYSYI